MPVVVHTRPGEFVYFMDGRPETEDTTLAPSDPRRNIRHIDASQLTSTDWAALEEMDRRVREQMAQRPPADAWRGAPLVRTTAGADTLPPAAPRPIPDGSGAVGIVTPGMRSAAAGPGSSPLTGPRAGTGTFGPTNPIGASPSFGEQSPGIPPAAANPYAGVRFTGEQPKAPISQIDLATERVDTSTPSLGASQTTAQTITLPSLQQQQRREEPQPLPSVAPIVQPPVASVPSPLPQAQTALEAARTFVPPALADMGRGIANVLPGGPMSVEPNASFGSAPFMMRQGGPFTSVDGTVVQSPTGWVTSQPPALPPDAIARQTAVYGEPNWQFAPPPTSTTVTGSSTGTPQPVRVIDAGGNVTELQNGQWVTRQPLPSEGGYDPLSSIRTPPSQPQAEFGGRGRGLGQPVVGNLEGQTITGESGQQLRVIRQNPATGELLEVEINGTRYTWDKTLGRWRAGGEMGAPIMGPSGGGGSGKLPKKKKRYSYY